jgi:hypothetical protein
MFCTVCGNPLPEDFKYIVCDPCFEKKRKEILSSSNKATPNTNNGSFGFSESFGGFSGFSGPSSIAGYVVGGAGMMAGNALDPWRTPITPREEQPPVAYYVYSERADRVEKDIEEKRRSRIKLKRLIRPEE